MVERHGRCKVPQQPSNEWVDDDPAWEDDTPIAGPAQSQSMLSRGWNAITTPLTDAPSRFARSVAGVDTPTEGGFMDAIGALPDIARNMMSEPIATMKGFFQGATEGVGNVLSQETSPLALASTAIGMPKPVRQGIGRGISSIANRVMGRPATEAIETASDIFARPPSITPAVTPEITPPATGGAPMFNPRGKTGMTGTAQSTAADMASKQPVAKIWLKSPTPEKVKQAAEQGYKFGGNVREDGAFQMVKSETPVPTPILESEVGLTRPTRSGAIHHQLGPVADVRKSSAIAEAINFPRGVMASWDFSAPLRQGIPLIGKKAWWTSFDDMFKSWGSENAFQAVQKSIGEKPLFRPRVGPGNKQLSSFAEDAGLQLTDLTDLSKREEAVMSTWAEKVPGVRRSNRAYVAFLNKLRADTFEDLIKKGKVLGADGEADLTLAREIANFVNTSTGRGNLGKLEQSAVALNSTFFSPRLIASRLTMLNPHYYWSASPMVRKEALKALFSVAAAGSTIGQLGRMAGGTVESDPTSSDYGKIRIGNTRLDPYAGFQQYITLANRLLRPEGAKMGQPSDTGIVPIDMATGAMASGGSKIKSSTTDRDMFFSEGEFGRPTKLDTLGRFGEGKLHPVWSFATGLLRGKDFTGQPFDVPKELGNRVLPIIVQDVIELANEDPTLLPLAIPAAFGMGMQSYDSR